MLSINSNLNASLNTQNLSKASKNSGFDEVLKDESEFVNFNEKELNEAQQNLTNKNQALKTKTATIELNSNLSKISQELLNKTKIKDLESGEFIDFKELFSEFENKDKFGADFFTKLKTQIDTQLLFLSLNGKVDISIESIEIVKNKDTILAGMQVKKGGEVVNISLNVDSDFYALSGVAAKIELGESLELKPFMQKYAQSTLDLANILLKNGDEYGLKYEKRMYENYLASKRAEFAKQGFISYNFDELGKNTQTNSILQGAKNSTLEDNLLEKLLKI